ncbi:hypothetical protein SDC9_116636 [bioreactor metagenome]|uniref:Uncharacterized protein n=1 Tax=bioreactor metagenome TaxID=1076179 RepID=A0A645BX63_9ZZZZ
MHTQLAVPILRKTDISAETDDDGFVLFPYFPYVPIAQPVFRQFDLVTVDEFLLEKSIPVADTVPVAGKSGRCDRIHEAGSQSSEAAVP